MRLPLCQLRPSTIFPPREVSGDRTSEEHENLYLASFPSSVIPGMSLATIMLKGLGGFSKSSHEELMKHSLTIPTAAQHIYGKESKPARKTGQMTLVASSMSQAPILWTRSSAPRTRCKQSEKIFPHPDYPPGCFIPCIPVFSTSSKPFVAVIMGSDSDLNGLGSGLALFKTLSIPFHVTITSAYRTHDRIHCSSSIKRLQSHHRGCKWHCPST